MANTEVVRPYESVVIMKPDATEEEQKNLFKRNKKIIESFKGTLHQVDTWGRRKLCNPIEKERTGIYFHSTFYASPESISELERTMKINEKVLRFLHLRLDDRVNLDKHLEQFKDKLAEIQRRVSEREAERFGGGGDGFRKKERKPVVS